MKNSCYMQEWEEVGESENDLNFFLSVRRCGEGGRSGREWKGLSWVS